MGGAARQERVILGRMQALLESPEDTKDKGMKAAFKLIGADDAVRIALLRLAINRQPEDLETVLDQIDALYSRVTAYEKYLDKKPLREFIPII